MIFVDSSDPGPAVVVTLLIINIVGTALAARGLKVPYEAHRQAGGARANLLRPILTTLFVLMLMAIALGVVAPAPAAPPESVGI
jgi:hypothetical protein